MFSLIMKDILIQKKRLLFNFAYILLIIFAFQSIHGAMFLASVVAFTYSLVMTACAYEDVNKSDMMLNSLPIKRKDIVAAKYLSVFVFFLLGTLAYLLLRSVISLLNLPLNIFPLTAGSLVSGIVSVGLITGIYFPVFFKFGYIKSKIFNFILFFGFFFGLTSLLSAFRDSGNPFMKAADIFLESQGELVITVILLAAVFIFMFISFSLSAAFYKRREF